VQPRVLIVSSWPGPERPPAFGLEVGGLPVRLQLRELLRDLLDGAAARGEPLPLRVDTLHVPYQQETYDVDVLDATVFPHRYDALILHIVMDSGARVTDRFIQALSERALEPSGTLVNPVTCIRKSTLHAALGVPPLAEHEVPCIIKLDRNYNRADTVVLCRTREELEAWRQRTPVAEQPMFVRERFHEDYRYPLDGLFRLERWLIAFDDLTVECRVSRDLFVKAATSFRFQQRDQRRLRADWALLGAFGWDWRGQLVDCAYDEDVEAWEARYRVMRQVTQRLSLQMGELDVIRIGPTQFAVIDVNNTPGIPMTGTHSLRLAQARLLGMLRDAAAGATG
jgi:hypothetical protein